MSNKVRPLFVVSLICVSFLMAIGFPVSVFAQEQNASGIGEQAYSQEMMDAYVEFCEYLSEIGIPADISLETFAEEYYAGPFSSLDDYLHSLRSLFVPPTEDSGRGTSGDQYWYYNTGTALMDEPNYEVFNLLSVVSPGDIVYENEGGFGLTGHISIVEGIFYDTNYSCFYIRLVEAIGYISGSFGEGDGVCRSVLDDDRYVDRVGTIYRVPSATTSQKSNAVSFCLGQIGKGYQIDLQHDTSANEDDWYCSELVWAAYYAQGIDLETTDTEPGLTPHEIRDSALTTARTVSTISTPQITSIQALTASSAKVEWNVVPGSAVQYYVYRATSLSGPYSLRVSTSNSSFTDTSLTSGNTYYYRIAANVGGLGNMGKPWGVKLAFSAPDITQSCSSSAISASLKWTAVYNATGYYVYRCRSSGGDYAKIATVTNPYYLDSGLTAGSNYYYKIEAYNSSIVTSKSSYKVVLPTYVKTPTIYFGKANSASSITIKWTHVPNATSYTIYRSTASGGTYSQVGTSVKTSYINSGLSRDTTYYYKIVAGYSGYHSAMSSYKAVHTLQ